MQNASETQRKPNRLIKEKSPYLLQHAANPVDLVGSLFDANATLLATPQVRMLAPLDRQEVWAAGVTYKRSKVARMEESETGASHCSRFSSWQRTSSSSCSRGSADTTP